MKAIKLECVLMGNKEIMFNGRSLGFVTDAEVEEFVHERDPSDFG